jgi:hypothetical protein
VGFESLRLQRKALEGQQQEIDETLRQLARAAQAQENLATAQQAATEVQRDLVRAQLNANRRAASTELAQRGSVVATLHGAYSSIIAAQYTANREHWGVAIEPEKQIIVKLIESESAALAALGKMVEQGRV